MKKRTLTATEQRECKLLRDLYNEKKTALKLSQERLGEHLGITQSGVSMYLNGKNALNLLAARKFANCLHVPIASFSPRLAEELEEFIDDSARRLGAARVEEFDNAVSRTEANAQLLGELAAWSDGEDLREDDCHAPYYAEVEFSGREGAPEVVEVTGRRVRLSNLILMAAGVDSKFVAVARAKGRNMERLILDGASIGFDRSYTSIIDGEIYALDRGGMLRLGYLYSMPGQAVRIRSENSEEYPDEILSRDQFRDEVKVLGRVFWWSTVRPTPRS